MNINRRDLLGGLAAAAVFPKLPAPSMAGPQGAALAASVGALPRKSDFDIPEGLTYINGAYTHPMPIVARDAVRRNAEKRSRPGGIGEGNSDLPTEVKQQFAALINAKPSEISFVPNTSTGENLVVNGLGIPRTGGNVVTDALHFDGSILHLQALQREYGLDLRVVMPRDGRIDLRDLERVIDRNTKLVEVSLVAMYNGFQHDLKAVCDLAHAHGAYVYADIVQAVGATPIDVRASGVDFCACSSFKWLMADFGLGFLYAREELLGRVVNRSQYRLSLVAQHLDALPSLRSAGKHAVYLGTRDGCDGVLRSGQQRVRPDGCAECIPSVSSRTGYRSHRGTPPADARTASARDAASRVRASHAAGHEVGAHHLRGQGSAPGS